MLVDPPGVTVEHRQPGGADRRVGLPVPPGPAHRVGHHDRHLDAQPFPDAGPEPRGAGVRVLREQRDLVGGDVGGVDPGGGLHDAQPVLRDEAVPEPGDHRDRLLADQFPPGGLAGLRVAGNGHQPALGLRDDLAGDHDDVVVPQPGGRSGDQRGQVGTGPDLGQPRDREQFEAARRVVALPHRRRGGVGTAPRRAGALGCGALLVGGGRRAHRVTSARSKAASTIAAVAATSDMSSGTERTAAPGTTAVSPVCTSQPSSRPEPPCPRPP